MLVEVKSLAELSTQELFAMPGLLKIQRGDWFVLLNGTVHSRWDSEQEAQEDARDLESWFL
jgi:hypothetical protein